MFWFMREEFKIAYREADKILKKIKCSFGKSININDIIKAVEEKTQTKIIFREFDFGNLSVSIDEGVDFTRYGAAMCVSEESGSNVARIMLNSRETQAKQRFSLVHELGHLVSNNMEDSEDFLFSTHIDMDITSIADEDLKDDPFLVGEQTANIFALLVLIPYDLLVTAMKRYDSLEDIAQMFGVEKEAVISRLMLGVESQE